MSSAAVSLDDLTLYFNRETSWLAFNRRVLEEAQNPAVPLLERLKFLAIFESNLDEFFMVRVGGLHQKVQLGIAHGSGADCTPAKQILEQIYIRVTAMSREAYRVLACEVLPGLQAEGIVLRSPGTITDTERRHVAEFFRSQVFPVLTPLAIDPGHPFPHLLNKSLNLAVMLRRPGENSPLFAVVQVPSVLPRFVPLPVETTGAGPRPAVRGEAGTTNHSAEPKHVLMLLENVIRLHLGEIFPGMHLDRSATFRVTRNSDFEIDDDEVEDLLKTIEEEVRKRRRGAAVRLQLEQDTPSELESFLTTSLDLEAADVFRLGWTGGDAGGMLDLTSLFQIHALPGYPHLRDPQFTPQPVAEFALAASPWAAIRERDILVHHPYESFGCVVDFIEAAANDERVLAIKQTLYRTSSDSPIVRALQRAADNGKPVTALIEIKARLDEERNILWARELEKSGVHVVFGFIGLKTHCKVALVVRREEDGSLRRYVHLSTGNYNPQTARIYTDLGYFTCNPDYGEDVGALFNHLTGYCELPSYRKLIVAPSRLLDFMLEKIEQETKLGPRGRVIAKLNGILEPAVIRACYRASQAGVKIDLICRGICALRPGVPGVSDNIRVISVVDRFLEHSRIFYFGNNGDPQVYIGSADWMDRNLMRRVEVVFPIEVPELKRRLIDEILMVSLADNVKARELHSDGTYHRVQPPEGQPRTRSQERFLEVAHLARAIPTLPPAPIDPRTVGGTRRMRKDRTN
ncbi:MAG: polyphosphate kinase 1 [Planctomycetia bacterium]|nr:polyphosphate kinase 1 [Planctomycetia bacterium]